ncbi:MAG: lipopolysaccharide heptosyltransferase II [Candidatus Protistobacter heckmanni]|nr:lipopolysaccharide heptosyltransferase II [Candidatus Protistobacter heckmanni]
MPGVLIIAPNWIGDALMAQPLIEAIAARHPGKPVDVLAPAWVAPVCAAMPGVTGVIPVALAHGKLQLADRWRFARTLRAKGYELALVLPNSLKSALIPWMAGIPVRAGYVGEMRVGLLNRRLPKPARSVSMVDRYNALLAPLGNEAADAAPTLPDPRLDIAPDKVRETAAQFGLADGQPFLALCPGAEYGPAKRWPAAHFARLAVLAHAREGAQGGELRIAALGGPGDAAAGQEIADACREHGVTVANLCGKTKLDQAIALLARADMAVCNDSGLMHVTAALGLPQVAVFGSSDPRHTPPRSPRATILWQQLECSPCFARVCPLGHTRCLTGIAPEQVLALLPEP